MIKGVRKEEGDTRVTLGHIARICVGKTKYVYVNMNDRDVREPVHNTIFLDGLKTMQKFSAWCSLPE